MTFHTPSGQAKLYFATDRLGDPDYRGILLEHFLSAAQASGLGWDPGTRARRVGPMTFILVVYVVLFLPAWRGTTRAISETLDVADRLRTRRSARSASLDASRTLPK